LFFPVNLNIRAEQLFVVSDDGKGLGILPREKALEKAKEQNLDLVIVNQKADPPVAKITDFRKFLYEERKKQQTTRKKGKSRELKKLRFKPNIALHDLEIRIKRARGFLENGNVVKFIIQFMGRQITHKEVGEEKLNLILEQLADLVDIEKEPWYEGKRLMVIVKPK